LYFARKRRSLGDSRLSAFLSHSCRCKKNLLQPDRQFCAIRWRG
jgi:hypothetical protein